MSALWRKATLTFFQRRCISAGSSVPTPPLLKLDVPRIMATLDGELGQTKKFAEPPPLSDHPRGALDFLMLQLSRIDWRRGVLILAVAVVVLAMILGYVGYPSLSYE